ncbi:MAG TPA: PAS domain S-box protein, partial [Dissulfurispiraceae bacterium]|nr:PAS domain S-box protein [Dissulfurispiraceae bacterium]
MSASAPSQPDSGDRNLSQAPASILTVVLVYAVFASLWILLSDTVVGWLFSDRATMVFVSTLKGWFFVAITSLLLYGLLRRMFVQMGAGESIKAHIRPLALPLILIAIAIIVLTAASIAHTLSQQKDKETARLQAIADLKTRQIADWIGERRNNARFVQTSTAWAEFYQLWRDKKNGASRDKLIKRLTEYQKFNSYASILLTNENGQPLWSSRRHAASDSKEEQAIIRQTSRTNEIGQYGPYADSEGTLHLDFFAPLPSVKDGRRPVVVLHSDPADYLLPLLQTWPVPSPSGETLLFQRDGDNVLFLNELRHKKDSAAKLRIPLSEKKLLAAQVLRGEAKLGGTVEGTDYRGAAVIGVARSVPGTDWYLVAKLDQSEVYAESLRYAVWIALVCLLALFMTATIAFLFRQRQELSASLQERKAQEEKLNALRLLDAIADGSTDAIYAKDNSGRYLLYNREASRVTNMPREAILGRDDTAIFPLDQARMLMEHDRRAMETNRSTTYEEVLTTSVGDITYLSTKGPLHDTAGNVIGMFGISRDITERKRAEDALRESEGRFRALFEHSPVAYQSLDEDGRFIDVNPMLRELLGYSRDELIGKSF